ncbi:MAG: hypothetical protein ABR875_00395 [Minisyncoccia bacterium]|jgi:hypothetical protein
MPDIPPPTPPIAPTPSVLEPKISEPKIPHSPKVTLLTILVVILTALVSGGAVYLWEQKQIAGLQENNQISQDNTLQNHPNLSQNNSQNTERYSDVGVPLAGTFSYPYQVQWMNTTASFALTGVTLGDIKISGDYGYYDTSGVIKNGSVIHALVLIFKIGTGNSNLCVDSPMRYIDSNGNPFPPITGQYMSGAGDCSANTTYTNQKVIFEVPSDEKTFKITTGASPSYFFTVNFKDDGSVELTNVKLPSI